MKYIPGILMVVAALAIFGVRISKGVVFKQQVTGYLKRAADANTVELAQAELAKVLLYLEKENLTTGNTGILWQTPDGDIDFWYRNLKASHGELQKIADSSSLEQTNALLKLRETLLDTGEKTSVTVPEGLSVYPQHKLWALLTTLAFALLMVGLTYLAVLADRDMKAEAGKS